jgi:hypothetical protein
MHGSLSGQALSNRKKSGETSLNVSAARKINDWNQRWRYTAV